MFNAVILLLLLLPLLGGIQSCGIGPDMRSGKPTSFAPPPDEDDDEGVPENISPELVSLVEEYYMQLDFFEVPGALPLQEITSISLVEETSLTSPGGTVIGVCTTTPTTATIELLQDYWWAKSAVERRALLYHELGHCSRGMGHVSLDIAGTSCPHLMRPTVPSKRDLRDCWGVQVAAHFSTEAPILKKKAVYMEVLPDGQE